MRVPPLAAWLTPTKAATLALAALLSACAATSPATELRFSQPVVLLGEVHDNAAQHALRLRAFEASLAAGARPALLMEQFDRDRQADIDRQRAQRPAPDAAALVAAASGPEAGWDWAFYKPFITLALRYELPIVAANVSRTEARAVMKQGLAASGFEPAVPADIEAGIVAAVLASHCGMLDEAGARRMALAQSARDQFMARMVETHAERGVLLLAGNGHVQNDLGVPRWLSPATRARSESIGLLEREEGVGRGAAAPPFDRVVFTASQVRADPCEGMRKPVAGGGASRQ
jgi:uncharacterized iron-regulated protein